MNHPTGKRPVIQMIVELTEHYFGRIHEGKMHYPQVAEALRDYAQAALKLEEPITAGSVLLTEALTHQAYDLFQVLEIEGECQLAVELMENKITS